MSRIRYQPPIPDSTYATKGGTPARLGYYDNYLVDNHRCHLGPMARETP